MNACSLWAASEGTLSHNNPFAVSGHFPGATTCLAQCGTASEVMAYDTIDHGVAATVSFINGSFYANVRAAFQHDTGLQAIWQAINISPWCAGCQGGKYPIHLYNAIHSGPGPGPQEEDEVKVIWERPNGAQYLELPTGKLVHVDGPTSQSLLANGWVIVGVSDVVANQAGMN